jgi:hypothetical protein
VFCAILGAKEEISFIMNNEEFLEYIESNDALFHYTKLSTGIENILEEGRLKLSCLQYTNDPQEYKFLLFDAMGLGE